MGKCVAVFRFRVRRQSAVEKLSVRDRSSARQPILRWGTICFELCAEFKHPVVLHKCSSYVFFLIRCSNWSRVLIKKKALVANLCSRCMIKIQKVKQRVSAVAYFTLRGEVIWVQTDRTKACPAALSFLGEKRWAGSASLETVIQVDLISVSGHCLSVEWLSVRFWTTTPHLAPEERRVDLC